MGQIGANSGLFAPDDKDLHRSSIIIAEIDAALIMVYFGGVQVERPGPVFGLGVTPLSALSVPFTVFATVGLINAMNMIDGADGLAGSLVVNDLAIRTVAALHAGDDALALGPEAWHASSPRY